MSGQEGLGRLFNIVPTAEDVAINLAYGSAVTFVCNGANAETFTVVESIAGASTASLACIDHYYKGAAVGASTWTKDSAPTSTSVVTTTTAAPIAFITVRGEQLSDTKTHVEVQASASGTVTAILHDLYVQRDPANLPALGV